ncbi:MAG: DUF4139 domain-containing protein [Bacteroidota bacterium]
MKRKFLLIVLIAASFVANATEKEIIKASISEVTVFAQGAQIFTKASYTIKPGITELIIEGVSPNIDPKSLQVKGTGNMILMDSKYQLYYPKPTPFVLEGLPLKLKKDIQTLEDSIELVAFELQDVQDEIDVLNSTKNILSTNGAMRGQGKVNDSINLLKQAVDYYATKMTELNKKLQLLQRKKKAIAVKKLRMDERLVALKNHQSNDGEEKDPSAPIHRIVVTVQTKELLTGKLSVSYLVSNAGWVPQYDLRSDGMGGKINLTYKANVYQNCGLDWDDVKLNISTNNPYQNKTKPTLHPWYIDYYTYRTDSYKGNAAPSAVPQMKKESLSESGYSYSNIAAEDMEAATSADFIQTVRQLSSIEFKIDLNYTIKSNNEQHMVLIKNTDMDAIYKYYAVPKVDNSVYLIAQITKLDELGLVPAAANIFFDGSYIGETYIDPTVMEDTLNLSMGRDPNIQIKRTLLKKELKEKVIGDKIEKTMAYSIEVKNSKATNITIVVQDQLPITTNADIMIEPIDLAKGKFDTRTGFVEWELNLKSKEAKTIDFSYKVKHNKDLNLYLY